MAHDLMSGNISLTEIAEKVSSIVENRVDFYDRSGSVAASTTPGWEKGIHPGVMRMVSEALDQLLCESDAGGADQMLLPVRGGRDAVYAVGIYGTLAELIVVGPIVQKLTEDLIASHNGSQSYILARKQFLYEWLLCPHPYDEQKLILDAQPFGIDVTCPRCVLILEPTYPTQDNISNYVKKNAQAKQATLFALSCFRDCLQISDRHKAIFLLAKQGEASVRECAQAILQAASGVPGFHFLAGIDETCASGLAIRNSIHHAKRALAYSSFLQEDPPILHTYSEVFWVRFMMDIPKSTKLEMVTELFPDCSEAEIDESLIMLRHLYDCDLSIKSAAAQMHIHPNTLRYRMSKLQESMIIDPCSCEGVARCIAAYNFWLSVYPERWKNYRRQGCEMDGRFYKKAEKKALG